MSSDKQVGVEEMAGWLTETIKEFREAGYVNTWNLRDVRMFQAILSLIERSGESDPMGCPSYGPQVEPTPEDAPPESSEEVGNGL